MSKKKTVPTNDAETKSMISTNLDAAANRIKSINKHMDDDTMPLQEVIARCTTLLTQVEVILEQTRVIFEEVGQ